MFSLFIFNFIAMKKKGRPEFKCIYCGKFVSYKDIDEDRVKVDFTPDTQFTVEKTEFYHTKCKKWQVEIH